MPQDIAMPAPILANFPIINNYNNVRVLHNIVMYV